MSRDLQFEQEEEMAFRKEHAEHQYREFLNRREGIGAVVCIADPFWDRELLEQILRTRYDNPKLHLVQKPAWDNRCPAFHEAHQVRSYREWQ